MGNVYLVLVIVIFVLMVLLVMYVLHFMFEIMKDNVSSLVQEELIRMVEVVLNVHKDVLIVQMDILVMLVKMAIIISYKLVNHNALQGHSNILMEGVIHVFILVELVLDSLIINVIVVLLDMFTSIIIA